VALQPHLEQVQPLVGQQVVAVPGAHDLPKLDLQVVAARRRHRSRRGVHLGEQVGLAHGDHRMRMSLAALGHSTAPPTRASKRKRVQKPALYGSGLMVVSCLVTTM
jgi:hypothetical protein